VDSQGCVYLAGIIDFLSYGNFHTTSGAMNETYNGGWSDACVLKLSADGSSLVYSTFLGG